MLGTLTLNHLGVLVLQHRVVRVLLIVRLLRAVAHLLQRLQQRALRSHVAPRYKKSCRLPRPALRMIANDL